MSFRPEALTLAVAKGFVDRLHRHLKTLEQPAKWPPARHQAQEMVAHALGFASWHALQKTITSTPSSPSPGHPAVLGSGQDPWQWQVAGQPSRNTAFLRHHALITGGMRPVTQAMSMLVQGLPNLPVFWVDGIYATGRAVPSLPVVLPWSHETMEAQYDHDRQHDSAPVLAAKYLPDDSRRYGFAPLFEEVLAVLVERRDSQGVPITTEAMDAAISKEGLHDLQTGKHGPFSATHKARLKAVFDGPSALQEKFRNTDCYWCTDASSNLHFMAQHHARLRIDMADDVHDHPTILSRLISAWQQAFPGPSLLVLNGVPDSKTMLYTWVTDHLARWSEQNHGVIVTSEASGTLPPMLRTRLDSFWQHQASQELLGGFLEWMEMGEQMDKSFNPAVLERMPA